MATFIRRSMIVGGVVSSLLLGGCYSQTTDAMEGHNPTFHGWVVYWDASRGEKELLAVDKAKTGVTYNGVSYFGAYYDKKGQLLLPKEFPSEVNVPGDRFLTIVNDKENEDGAITRKDPEFVAAILKSDGERRRHAKEILDLAHSGGYNGVEIDYERVWKDVKLRNNFAAFLKILQEQATKRHLALRVILEPSVDYSKVNLPKGPTYVIMAYNLFGTHSGPGPKADYQFLRKTARSLDSVPRPHGVALSTGGCYWDSTGVKKFIATTDAIRLAKKYDVTPERDSLSGALHFTYTDEAGVTATIWYADETTIELWIKTVKPYELDDISIWRMGDHEVMYDLSEARTDAGK